MLPQLIAMISAKLNSCCQGITPAFFCKFVAVNLIRIFMLSILSLQIVALIGVLDNMLALVSLCYFNIYN